MDAPENVDFVYHRGSGQYRARVGGNYVYLGDDYDAAEKKLSEILGEKPTRVRESLRRVLMEAWGKDKGTLRRIERKCGVNYSVLYRFVNGETDNIKISTADAICRELGMRLRISNDAVLADGEA